jgi:predicted NUDIX family NTP pyrophosphohydrolase
MVDSHHRLLLVHPGGPYFAKRDRGVWSVPKGLVEPGESLLGAALRELREELGCPPEPRVLFSLGEIHQSNKTVHAWAFRGDWDPARLDGNAFELEWPPRSGKTHTFPEVDRAEFFALDEALARVIPAQRPLLERAVRWAREGMPGAAITPSSSCS